jgi:hypothetical protein
MMLDDTNELETLRRTNSELVAKNATRKQRIKELEEQVSSLEAKNTDSAKRIRDLEIGTPLKQMADSLSNVPELLIEQLQKHYAIELADGKLALQTPDGKPIATKDGKFVAWDQQALRDYLTGSDNPQARVFQTLIIASRASGAGGSTHQNQRVKKDHPNVSFGLR